MLGTKLFQILTILLAYDSAVKVDKVGDTITFESAIPEVIVTYCYDQLQELQVTFNPEDQVFWV